MTVFASCAIAVPPRYAKQNATRASFFTTGTPPQLVRQTRYVIRRSGSTVLGPRSSVHLDLPPELLVLVADEFDRLLVRHHALVDAHRERLGERLRILDRHIDFKFAENWT